MILRKPTYFDSFHCIAGRCPDSCCKEWDVQVDSVSTAYYRSLPGPLGDRLRQVLVQQEDGSAEMAILEGRCPMWRDDGLCRIQAELGEEALCRTCREFPRLTHDYGDFIELGLELSCPEAAGFILSDLQWDIVQTVLSGGEAPEYDEEAMSVLLRTRDEALALLRESMPLPQALTLLLLYGYHAQEELDGGAHTSFEFSAALQTAKKFASPGDFCEVINFFSNLEVLTPDWAEMLAAPEASKDWSSEIRAIAGYLVRRYWLQAVSDYDLACRVKFIVIACLLVRHLGGNLRRTAQLFSKEIENSAHNVDAILDAAYSHPAFTDVKLLGYLNL